MFTLKLPSNRHFFLNIEKKISQLNFNFFKLLIYKNILQKKFDIQMSKLSDTNGIPLNLSLNGLQFKSRSSNSSKPAQKSSNLSQRSNISLNSPSTVINVDLFIHILICTFLKVNDTLKKKNEQKSINPSSSRSASSFSDKKSKLPPYLKKLVKFLFYYS